MFGFVSLPGSSSNSFSSVKWKADAMMFVGKTCIAVLYAVTSMLYSLLAACSWSSIFVSVFCRFRKFWLAFSSG